MLHILFVQALSIDNKDNIYINGYYSGRSAFDGFVLTANETSHDMFIAKISMLTGITGNNNAFQTPGNFELIQNYPNPFNPETKISYQLPFESKVLIKVFDMTGREVITLVNEVRPAGENSVVFHGNDLPSGSYFYSLHAARNSEVYSETRKMFLLK